MINKTKIQNNLKQIDNLYRKNIGDKIALYFSKLAIIEACGWIEESMDDIIRVCVKKRLKEKKNLEFVEDCIRETHSFKYYTNFRNMLIQMLGIVNLEKLELFYDKQKFTYMTSSLGILKQRRDEQAHTHIKGRTQIIDAPSITINHFQKVYNGLKDIESCMRKMTH